MSAPITARMRYHLVLCPRRPAMASVGDPAERGEAGAVAAADEATRATDPAAISAGVECSWRRHRDDPAAALAHSACLASASTMVWISASLRRSAAGSSA